jgi:hypothetical protein
LDKYFKRNNLKHAIFTKLLMIIILEFMKHIFLLIFIVITIQSYSDEWEIDINQCTKVIERFFFNGIENKDNSPIDQYYDINGNLVLRILYNRNGQERSRQINKYNEMNELTEYSVWDNSAGAAQWRRWLHRIIEKTAENDKIIFLIKEKRYFDDYKLIEIKIKNTNGNLISEMEIEDDILASYRIYNDKNDVIYYRYQNEKSNGIREERYLIEYDSHFNKGISIKTYENEKLIYETVNKYDGNGILLQSITLNYLNNIQFKQLYTYDDKNNLIEDKLLDNNDDVILIRYYQYDKENRRIKQGEKDNSYDRYWTYEY